MNLIALLPVSNVAPPIFVIHMDVEKVCDSQYISLPIIGRREESEKRSMSHLLCCDANLCNNDYQMIGTPIPSLTTRSYPLQTQPNGTDISCFKVFFLQQEYTVNRESDLFVAGNSTVKITVQEFSQNYYKTVLITPKNFAFPLGDTVRITADGAGQHGALICTNDTASIYGFYDARYGGEGYLAIPAKYQSTIYVIPSFNIINIGRRFKSRSIMAVSPLNTNTTVHILLQSDQGPITVNNVKYSLNSSITMVLNPYETFQLSHTHDLTGTLVTSSAPVFVISGSNCINTYNTPSVYDCNPIMEMILPTDQLDSLYVIPEIAKYKWSTVRVLSINATSITFKNTSSAISILLRPREYLDFQHEKISYIQSSDNVIVTVYPQYTLPGFFDTFMMTIHGVNQYLPEYHFAVPSKGFSSFISIVVQSSEIGGFILDDKRITLNIYSISHGSDDFSTGSVSIEHGAHHIKHLNGTKFGLWVYGSKQYDGYGYPGGIQFRN
ncbi:uncharacterized protein LOC134688013 [Mytilus trossulus]|uniref:uncharacterized protein LOC134688013 n=1 Tax=Mytilus trossulus TaxID=6551 RepID=UPI003005DA9D